MLEELLLGLVMFIVNFFQGNMLNRGPHQNPGQQQPNPEERRLNQAAARRQRRLAAQNRAREQRVAQDPNGEERRQNQNRERDVRVRLRRPDLRNNHQMVLRNDERRHPIRLRDLLEDLEQRGQEGARDRRHNQQARAHEFPWVLAQEQAEILQNAEAAVARDRADLNAMLQRMNDNGQHHVGFRPRFGRRRQMRLDRDDDWYLSARQDLLYFRSCRGCKGNIDNKDFLNHLERCPGCIEDYRNKVIYVHAFKSDNYSLNVALLKLRDHCEVSYLEYRANREKLEDVECRLCSTFEEHMAGGCQADNMREVFILHANLISNEILAHYEQMLELQKQRGIDDLLSSHNFFQSIEGFVVDAADDLDAEHQRQAAVNDMRQNTVDPTPQRTRFIERQTVKNKAAYDRRKDEVKTAVEQCTRSMVSYLHRHKNSDHINSILRDRASNRIEDIINEAAVPERHFRMRGPREQFFNLNAFLNHD